jgi:hypothetical protein
MREWTGHAPCNAKADARILVARKLQVKNVVRITQSATDFDVYER